MASKVQKPQKRLFNLLDWFCILVGVITSIATIFFNHAYPPIYIFISIVALNCAILSTVLSIKGRRINFIFAILNAIAYAYTAWYNQFYGNAVVNILVYMPFSIFGFFYWGKNSNKNKEVIARKLTPLQIMLLAVAVIVATIVLNDTLISYGGASTILDSMATILVFFASCLAALRYREQWLVWFLGDLLQLIMWTATNDSTILAMRIFFLLSSIYGYINWRKFIKTSNSKKRKNKN